MKKTHNTAATVGEFLNNNHSGSYIVYNFSEKTKLDNLGF
jgi:hypothetical protein